MTGVYRHDKILFCRRSFARKQRVRPKCDDAQCGKCGNWNLRLGYITGLQTAAGCSNMNSRPVLVKRWSRPSYRDQMAEILFENFWGGYAERDHPFPYRTRPLSLSGPMVLRFERGRVGRRPNFLNARSVASGVGRPTDRPQLQTGDSTEVDLWVAK